MNHTLRAALFMLATGSAAIPGTVSAANPITPMFDVDGFWWAPPDRDLECIVDGLDVQCTMFNSFAQVGTGRFTSKGVVYLDWTRTNLHNYCTTYMDVYLYLMPDYTMRLLWRARDSHCDLREGQVGVDPTFHRSN